MPETPITPVETSKPRRGAAVLLEILRSEGVKYIFGNPGTTELPLMDALIGVTDINYVVTEHGVAQLRGKSARQRAAALIAIAHPDFRHDLLQDARRLRYA